MQKKTTRHHKEVSGITNTRRKARRNSSNNLIHWQKTTRYEETKQQITQTGMQLQKITLKADVAPRKTYKRMIYSHTLRNYTVLRSTHEDTTGRAVSTFTDLLRRGARWWPQSRRCDSARPSSKSSATEGPAAAGSCGFAEGKKWFQEAKTNSSGAGLEWSFLFDVFGK